MYKACQSVYIRNLANHCQIYIHSNNFDKKTSVVCNSANSKNGIVPGGREGKGVGVVEVHIQNNGQCYICEKLVIKKCGACLDNW